MRSPHLLIVLAILNIPVYVAVYRKFFDDFDELEGGLSALDSRFLPRLANALSGRWYDNQWAKTKLLVACVFCGLLVLLEYGTVMDHAPAIASWLDQAW